MAIAKCKISLAPRNLLRKRDLDYHRNWKETADFVGKMLDMERFSAILAIGCEEC
jgi:hypothetical protein